MIGNLARRSEQTENKAVEQTDARYRRISRGLAFADHMNRFITGDRAPSSPEEAEMRQARGVQHLSLREPSRELGVSHASPQRHFATKQDLIDALAIMGYE
jgi:hypothetical protein